MRSGRAALIKALILATAVWAVYWNSLGNPFEFDDWHVIPQNPEVRGPADIPEFFTDVSKFSVLPANRDYRPLFLTSMALAWWVGEGSTTPFHVVSVALHMGSVVVLFLILRIVFRRRGDSPSGLEAPEAEWAAFLGALLYAFHPLATEAVVYISSQSESMAGFFSLLALLLFLVVYGESSSSSARGLAAWGSRLGSYLSYLLALLSKPVAVTLPLALVVWELLFGRRESPAGAEPRARSAELWSRARKHLPYVGVTLLYLLVRGAVAGNPVRSVAVVSGPDEALWFHYLTQTKALVFYYLRLALVPIGQNVDREYPLEQSLLSGPVLAALAILAAAGWLLYRFRRHRAVVFWALWFPICLLVATYVVRLGQTVREARVYLSLAGICAIAGLLVVELWRALPIRISDSTLGRRSGKAAVATLVGIVLVALAYGTYHRNHVWSSSLTLWGDAASKQGTWRAHMNYALALEATDKEAALTEFQKAVELGPYAFSHLNLGLAYIRRGDNEKGLSHLRTAVQLWPESADTHYHLGVGLDIAGDPDGAEHEFREAIARRSNFVNAHRRLAQLHERQGRPILALESYRRLRELEPSLDWIAEKIEALESGSPSWDADSLFREAFALQKRGERQACIALYEQLLRLDPDHRQGTFNLAYAYLHGDGEPDWSRASELFRRVLEIDPRYTEAVFHLATVHWKLDDVETAKMYDAAYLDSGTHEDLKARSRERLAGS